MIKSPVGQRELLASNHGAEVRCQRNRDHLANRVSFCGTVRQSICKAAVDLSALGLERGPELADVTDGQVRLRFAPSPTGYLHVGGARTALFNYLYAKNQGGKFILRVEDTDQARSTKESEAAVLEDMKWLGMHWDEGPDIGGPYGPYRQSERKEIYQNLAQDLIDQNLAYEDFCTDEELAQMKKEAEIAGKPQVYRGKWKFASRDEIEAEKAKGTPYCVRFRVEPDRKLLLKDVVKGRVVFDTNTLGDFVIMRSNGLPVYNFCVAIDDAYMKITHVMRADEHLNNTMRQLLVFEALGLKQPVYAHVPLILAPDKSKLSKRHGATSVGQYRELGILSDAMMNYLALLGWSPGQQEVLPRDQLISLFKMEEVNNSAAVFDKSKLYWMNSQHLHNIPIEDIGPILGEQLKADGIIQDTETPFVKEACAMLLDRLSFSHDITTKLKEMLDYPLQETVQTPQFEQLKEDNLREVVEELVRAYDDGRLLIAASEGFQSVKKLEKALGKQLGRKGRRLFLPVRVALTGRLQGPEVAAQIAALAQESGDVVAGVPYVPINQRIEQLRDLLETL